MANGVMPFYRLRRRGTDGGGGDDLRDETCRRRDNLPRKDFWPIRFARTEISFNLVTATREQSPEVLGRAWFIYTRLGLEITFDTRE